MPDQQGVQRSEPPTIALVHGGSHGAWCWSRLTPLLSAGGVDVVTMDLPGSDPSAGAATYASIVVDAIASVRGPVVLVGHSLAGLVIPLVAAARPVDRLVFLAALLPEPGRSFMDQQGTEQVLYPFPTAREDLRGRWYNACAPEDADWAFRQTTEQAQRPLIEPTPLSHWPPVASSYIVCGHDHACRPDWGRRAASERLGIAALEIEGADHSPFLSRRRELATLLLDLAGGAAA